MVLCPLKFAGLSEDESKVAEVIGVREAVLSRHATGMGRKMVSHACSTILPHLSISVIFFSCTLHPDAERGHAPCLLPLLP